ncbi:MAG: 2,3-bisphosphoglycerate-independent phosphoglycerate mutase [Gammaproteobacteria bacterium]|nr:MAG: 2,3-bisphosphoglycerate-independent phosphoglycerate mutase [Gammaproteobacteria bacterium]
MKNVPRQPVLLIILDGFGVNPSKANNAVAEARTPKLDEYFAHHPHITLQASGHAVGLPDGQMGNSEVGHMTLGCGAIVKQDMVHISDAIENGEFFQNPVLLSAVQKAAQAKRPLHLLGLVSDGGVHSSMDHIKALIKLCNQYNAKPLLHMITDGRDTSPQSAINYVHDVEPSLHEAGGSIASIMGRYYAMDRDKRWDRTELAWRALILGNGENASSAETAIGSAYASGDHDEFIRPILLPSFQVIKPEDQVIFFNFRKDRPRQIIRALVDESFAGFDRGDYAIRHNVTCLMPYNRLLDLPYAFEPEKPEVTLSQIISKAGIQQFHCAETEKYPHVTYFFNGGRADPHSGETHLVIPSPTVPTYDHKPSMSADKITQSVIDAIKSNKYGFIVVNYANGDMVGHTAIREAVLAAVETLDKEVSQLLDTAVEHNYSVILTADHGNCEELVDPFTQAPHTQHTTYPVPCMVIDQEQWQLSCAGGLSNIAPTVLELMGLEKPEQMTADSLLLKRQRLTTANYQSLKGAA